MFGKSRLDPKIRLWRTQVMIVTSLAAMFGALVPTTIQLVSDGPESLWRSSSAVLLLLVVGQLAFVYRAMPAEQATGPLRLLYGPVPVALTVASVSFQALLAAVVAGFLLGLAPAIYSTAVLFLLLASSFHFLRLVRAALPEGAA